MSGTEEVLQSSLESLQSELATQQEVFISLHHSSHPHPQPTRTRSSTLVLTLTTPLPHPHPHNEPIRDPRPTLGPNPTPLHHHPHFPHPQEDFLDLLDELVVRTDQIRTCGDLERAEEYSAIITLLQEDLAEAVRKAEMINVREELFGWPLTRYEQISYVKTTLTPYADLWREVAEITSIIPKWMDGPFIELVGPFPSPPPPSIPHRFHPSLTPSHFLPPLLAHLLVPSCATLPLTSLPTLAPLCLPNPLISPSSSHPSLLSQPPVPFDTLPSSPPRSLPIIFSIPSSLRPSTSLLLSPLPLSSLHHPCQVPAEMKTKITSWGRALNMVGEAFSVLELRQQMAQADPISPGRFSTLQHSLSSKRTIEPREGGGVTDVALRVVEEAKLRLHQIDGKMHLVQQLRAAGMRERCHNPPVSPSPSLSLVFSSLSLFRFPSQSLSPSPFPPATSPCPSPHS